MFKQLRKALGLWRGAAVAGGLASAAAVLVVVGLNRELDTTGTQLSQVNEQRAQLVAQLQAAPKIEYVAVLADDKANASVLVTFDPHNRRLVLKRVGGYQEASDRSLQLWALPPGGGAKSLGVMGTDPVVRLTALEGQVRDVPTLAISLEPKGGVPGEGGPTGPVLFKGAAIHRDGSVGRDLVLNRAATCQVHRIACHAHAGEGCVAVACCKQVTHSAAPARCGAFGRRCLPERLLVVVRKKLGRKRYRLRAVLGLGGGLDECAHVEHHSHASRVEHGQQRRQPGCQRKLLTGWQRHRGREDGGGQRSPVQCDVAAKAAIDVVTRLVPGHQRIGLVVAAVKKDAHQRLVVGGGGCGRLAHGGQAHGPWRCASCQGQRCTPLQKRATGRGAGGCAAFHGMVLFLHDVLGRGHDQQQCRLNPVEFAGIGCRRDGVQRRLERGQRCCRQLARRENQVDFCQQCR
jgi:anti-sigma-K factor RskA